MHSNTRGRRSACLFLKGSSDFLLLIFVYAAAFRISDIYLSFVTLQPRLTLIYVQSCTFTLPPAAP